MMNPKVYFYVFWIYEGYIDFMFPLTRDRRVAVSACPEDWSCTLCLYEWLHLYTAINSTSPSTHCDIDSHTILPLYVLLSILFPYPSLWFIIESRNFSPLLHLLLLFQRIPPSPNPLHHTIPPFVLCPLYSFFQPKISSILHPLSHLLFGINGGVKMYKGVAWAGGRGGSKKRLL